ncbi:MAG: MarR family winged helix-turn-helix transcriptional regulator [Gammaproteobacteria bacterium]
MTTPTAPLLLLNLAEQQAQLHRKIDLALGLHGISFTEFSALKQLHGAAQQQMRRIDLAQCIGLTASGVTRMLNPMEKIGLIEKLASDRDARVSLVKLTIAGQRLLGEAEVSFTHYAEKMLQPFSETERKQFGRLIEKMR